MRNTLIEEPEAKVTEDLLTVCEVAARLRLKASWVYSHSHQLGAYRLGKYIRFSWPRVLERLDQTTGSTV